jgi:hypothetical protein
MNIDELKPGDVLIYSAPDDSWISKAIAFLTGSSVSHAALSYFETSRTVEQSPPCTRFREARETFEGRSVYVMRHKGGVELAPVLNAAHRYVELAEPYPMSNLYLLGLILIYRKFNPDTIARRVIVKVLKSVTRQVIEFVNSRRFPGKLPMVCSQFVFQCYDDAGDDCRLAISKGVLLKAAVPSTTETNCLERAIAQSPQTKETPLMQTTQARSEKRKDETEEDLARELLEALDNRAVLLSAGPETGNEDELLAAVADFSHVLNCATQGAGEAGLSMSGEQRRASVRSGFKVLSSNEALFVTPADLLKNCRDLEQVGVIEPG